jgi:hypothetical protein
MQRLTTTADDAMVWSTGCGYATELLKEQLDQE